MSEVIPISAEQFVMYPEAPRISTAEFEKRKSYYESNRSYCGAIEFKRQRFVLTDDVDVMTEINQRTGLAEKHQVLAVRFIDYCEPCMKLIDKRKQCNRCEKWFIPGCNIKFICQACCTVNKTISAPAEQW